MNNLLFVLLDASQVRWIFGDLFRALIWIGLFAAVFFAYYYYLQARNRERMAMIEKGNDLSELYQPKQRFNFPWFKLIFTLLGCGIGGFLYFGMAIGLDDELKHIERGPLVLMLILLFGALGMLAGHFMDMKFRGKNQNNQ